LVVSGTATASEVGFVSAAGVASAGFPESNEISSPSFPIIASNESTGAVSPAGILYVSVPSLKIQIPLLLYRFQFLQECLLRLLYRLLFLSQVATVPSVIVSLKRGIVIIVAIIDL
jgi:hypothetical protein